MTDVPSALVLNQYRQLSGLSVEECWAAYYALGGDEDLAAIRDFLTAGADLAGREVDIVAAAITDLRREPHGDDAALAHVDGDDAALTHLASPAAQEPLDLPDFLGVHPAGLAEVTALDGTAFVLQPGLSAPVLTVPDLLATADGLAVTDGALLRVDGAENAAWEIHRTGYELIVLLAGAARLVIDRDDPTVLVLERPYQSCAIPKGHWHHHESTRSGTKVLFITPMQG